MRTQQGVPCVFARRTRWWQTEHNTTRATGSDGTRGAMRREQHTRSKPMLPRSRAACPSCTSVSDPPWYSTIAVVTHIFRKTLNVLPRPPLHGVVLDQGYSGALPMVAGPRHTPATR